MNEPVDLHADEKGQPGTSGKRRGSGRERFLLALTRDLVVAGVLLLLVGVFLVQPFRVEGSSMEPLLSAGERVIVSKAAYRWGEIERFDVVVLNRPGGRTLVKRIVGLPGERISIEDGRVLVNGELLDETHVAEDRRSEETRRVLVLGRDEYFVLGDNRSVSIDSRRFGAVSREAIRGKAVLRYWPLDDAGAIEPTDGD